MDNKEMKKKKPYTSKEFMNLLDEEWGNLHDSTDTDVKIDRIGNLVMLTFVYMLSRYDYKNYLNFINNDSEEVQDNG